jgi:hypothetical protein
LFCAPIAHTLITNQVEVRISHFGSIYHCWTFPVINTHHISQPTVRADWLADATSRLIIRHPYSPQKRGSPHHRSSSLFPSNIKDLS